MQTQATQRRHHRNSDLLTKKEDTSATLIDPSNPDAKRRNPSDGDTFRRWSLSRRGKPEGKEGMSNKALETTSVTRTEVREGFPFANASCSVSLTFDPKLDMRMTIATRRKEESHAPAGAFSPVGIVAPGDDASAARRCNQESDRLTKRSRRRRVPVGSSRLAGKKAEGISPEIQTRKSKKEGSNQRLEINAVYAHRNPRVALALLRPPRRVSALTFAQNGSSHPTPGLAQFCP